jgi:hypothetical protein
MPTWKEMLMKTKGEIFCPEQKLVFNQNYLLLNNQSTVNQVANVSQLKNIRKLDEPIVVHSNAGSTKTNLVGELRKITIHHNHNSIANVLFLKSVAARHRVTYERNAGGYFKFIPQVVFLSSSQVSKACITWICQKIEKPSNTCW